MLLTKMGNRYYKRNESGRGAGNASFPGGEQDGSIIVHIAKACDGGKGRDI